VISKHGFSRKALRKRLDGTMPGLEGLSEQKSEGFRQKENMLCTDFNIGTKHMQVVFTKLL